MRRLVPLALLALPACEPAVPPAPPPAPAPITTAAPAPPPAFAGNAGTFRSERFSLRLPLPDGRAWRIDDHGSTWLTAAHPPSSSALAVRSWTEEGRVPRTRCEERARLRRALPDRAGADILQDRAVDAPAGFDTQLVVGVAAAKPGAPIAAFALAIGARAHRCFVWSYTTTAEGLGAERVVGERLAIMIETSLMKAAIDDELRPQIPREPGNP